MVLFLVLDFSGFFKYLLQKSLAIQIRLAAGDDPGVIAMFIKLNRQVRLLRGFPDIVFDVRIGSAFEIGDVNEMKIGILAGPAGGLQDFSAIAPVHIFIEVGNVNRIHI